MSKTGVTSIDELVETFDLLDTWEDRYQLLIDLGNELPPMPGADMCEQNRVQGCQSAVWLTAGFPGSPPVLECVAQSDSQIVRGLIAALMMVYQGKSPREILDYDIRGLFDRLGFNQHLSRSRSNGLFSMVKRIQELARQHA